MTTVVTLCVLSGLPDPQWSMADSEVEQVHALVREIEDRAQFKPPLTTPGLGYRGLTIETNDPRLPERVCVYRGVATIRRGATEAHYEASGLERILLGLARGKVSGNLLDAVEQALR